MQTIESTLRELSIVMNLIKYVMNARIREHILSNLFGGYATSRKHEVFSRLVLNSYINYLIK
jgi:hypothetical protein